ncbi:MAG TPA: ATPase [Cyanobacteria bacterium UBA11149]|nr:ATPase [Cyanobacteria bacterium UBA11367]HBE58014.1 ATPase [Cyanobacteria bacterium UBA11366]HBK66281.1 ATPase [Cyanobacteria bacterium UBA11166]HBR72405.1 ATPase [Cyanobacteria bacterium UBA11159]HBS71747.1 ATPase [Cyanobacteria bacterium UBA11153]HBW90562.1 ATPase [Cyanobacteria bacterium UBA11149]HCA93951.1 ATPase [Cyanobacteria bacterium UBA9226]
MTQLFNDLTIRGFRRFPEVHLSDLRQINIIVGINNSGKTSLLEAISIFCNPLNPFRWLEVSQRRLSLGRNLTYRPDLESIRWIFQKQENLSGSGYFWKMEIEASGNAPIKKLETNLLEIWGSPSKQLISTQSDEDNENLSYDLEYSLEGLELEVIAHHTSFHQMSLFSSQESGVATETFQFWENERFIQKKSANYGINSAIISPAYSTAESTRFTKSILEDKTNKNEIIDLIRLFDPDITDILILSPKKAAILYLDHQKLGLTPLYAFGDGLKRTLGIILALHSAKKGVLLIDEIETSIHVSALNQFFSWLVAACLAKEVQLFVTTHSLEAVDAIIQSNVSTDDLAAFRLNTTDEPIKRFSGNLLNRLRLERGLDVR